MDYTYRLTLAFTDPEPITAEEKRLLLAAIESYNQKSLLMNNPKQLKIVQMRENSLVVDLSSTQALSTPGRGLRTLTALLLKSEAFQRRVGLNGHLFRTVKIGQPSHDSTEGGIDQISDLDFLKALLDYVYSKKDASTYRKKKIAFEEMKKLAISSGIITPKTQQKTEQG